MAYTPSNISQSLGTFCDKIYFDWTCDAGDSIIIEQKDGWDDTTILTATTLAGDSTSYSANTYYYEGILHTIYATNNGIYYRVVNVVSGIRYESNWESIEIKDYPRPDTHSVTGITNSQATIKWDNHQDDGLCNNSVSEYEIILYYNLHELHKYYWRKVGTDDFPFSANTFTFTGLSASTYYTYSIGVRPISDIDGGQSGGGSFTTAPPPFSAGTIAANQTICYNGNPAAFTSVADASGGTTGYTYQWQYSTDSGSTWNDISGAGSTTYDSGTLTATRWFRRRVIDSDSPASTGYSNTLEVTVYSALGAGTIAANQSIYSGQTPALLTSVVNASGASGSYVYQWQNSTNGVSYSNIAGATSATYQPPALTVNTYYKRRVYDTFCGIGGADYSNVVLITILPQPEIDDIIYVYSSDADTEYKITISGLTTVYSKSGTPSSPRYLYGDYIYAGAGLNQTLKKYSKYNLSLITQTAGNVAVNGNMVSDGVYLYVPHGGSISRYDLDLNFINTVATINAYNLAYNNGYLYAGGYDGYLKKIDLSSDTVIATSPYAGGLIYDVIINGNYVYEAGTSNYIHKYSLNDITTVLASGNYGDNIRSISADNNYIYAGGEGIYRVRKYNISDLSYVTQSASFGGQINDILYYNNKVYAARGKLYQLNSNDLSTFDTLTLFGGLNFILSGINELPPTDLPPSFCEGSHWTASGSTCGNADGYITIVNYDFPIVSYFDVYDFTLTDVDGNSYSFNTTTGEATGLTSNYYFLTATVKPAYWYYYGRDECTFDWIKIEDSDNTSYLNRVVVTPLQCQPFDVQYGRIYYEVSGLTSGNTFSFDAYTSDLSVYYSATGITSTQGFILRNAEAQCYWVRIKDEVGGCTLLLDNRCVNSIPLFSLSGIKKLWIAAWNDDLDYNYWSTADDDYFLEFEDTSFFTSTKIKEFLSLTGGTTGVTWYSLPVAGKVATLGQKLNKVPQGYIFEDTLSFAISKADADKWTKMATIINPENKWIYVVQCGNGFYWCGGYRHSGRITAYNFDMGAREADNGYKLTISCQSENKLLTNLDENYVINYIL